jgi:hypothetical protein
MKMTIHQKNEIIELVKKGKSDCEISKILNKDHTSISDFRYRHNLKANFTNFANIIVDPKIAYERRKKCDVISHKRARNI